MLVSKLTPTELRGLRKASKGLTAVQDAQFQLMEAGQLDARLLRMPLPQKVQFLRAIREKRRERALNDFFYFSKYVYGNIDLTTMHEELCSFAASEGERKLILEPRGSLKSSVVTQSYILWRLVRDPNLRVLVDSEEHARAKAFVSAIKATIEQNENFRELFGKLDANKNKPTWTWTESAFTISTRTKFTPEANVMCMGLDSTRIGYHYDLIVMDDMVSDQNTRTDAQIKKVVDHYQLMLSILDPGKEMIVIGTRWHFADLYGYLLSKDEARVKKGRLPQWKTLIRSAIRQDGSLLWPERLTREFLMGMREEQGSYKFSCQYLNDPTGGEDASFKREWLKFYTELPETPLTVSIVMDPSLGKTKKSDYTAITIQARDYHNNRYMVRVMRGRWNPTKALQMVVYARQWVIDTYGLTSRVGIETQAFQWVLAHNLREMMKKGRIPVFKIHELQRTTDTTKHLSIEKLVPIFEQGLVHLRGKSVENCSAGAKFLIEEYLQFPTGKYDDIMDTLAYHEELARIPQLARKDRKTDTFLQKVLKDAKRRGSKRGQEIEVGSRIGTGGKGSWRSGTSQGT